MKKNLNILLIALITVTSCLPQTSQKVPQPAESGKATPESGSGGIKTPASSVATAALSPDLASNCLHMLPDSDNPKIGGTSVFLDNLGQSIVFMGENELRIPGDFKGNNATGDQSVSPNGKFLMYRQAYDYGDHPTDAVSTNIMIAASDGTVINRFKDLSGGIQGPAWISDEYIRYPARNGQDGKQLQLFALNVQTGEYQKLRTDLPDLADGARINWGIDNWAIYYGLTKGVNVVYDPSLSRAAYPRQGSLVLLYDIQNDMELATTKLADGGHDPQWSPNGQYFTIEGVDPTTLTSDIYAVPRQGGQFIRLTNLARIYPKVSFGSYSWSPDGQYIAFWMTTDGNRQGFKDSLILLNLATMKMTDTCIRGLGSYGSILSALEASNYAWNANFMLSGKPVWSPDGRYILIAQFDTEKQKAIDILINLEDKTASPIAVDLEPMGWMQ